MLKMIASLGNDICGLKVRTGRWLLNPTLNFTLNHNHNLNRFVVRASYHLCGDESIKTKSRIQKWKRLVQESGIG